MELFDHEIAEVLGVGSGVYDVWAYTNFDVPVGSFVEFDVGRTTASSPEAGFPTSVLANVKQPTLAGSKFGLHGITLTAGRSGSRTLVRIIGPAYLLIGGDFSAGANLVVGDTSDVQGKRVKAYTLEAGGSSGLLGFGLVFVNGIRGMRGVMASGTPGGGQPPGGFDIPGFGGTTAPPSPGIGTDVPPGSLGGFNPTFTVGGIGSIAEF